VDREPRAHSSKDAPTRESRDDGSNIDHSRFDGLMHREHRLDDRNSRDANNEKSRDSSNRSPIPERHNQVQSNPESQRLNLEDGEITRQSQRDSQEKDKVAKRDDKDLVNVLNQKLPTRYGNAESTYSFSEDIDLGCSSSEGSSHVKVHLEYEIDGDNSNESSNGGRGDGNDDDDDDDHIY